VIFSPIVPVIAAVVSETPVIPETAFVAVPIVFPVVTIPIVLPVFTMTSIVAVVSSIIAITAIFSEASFIRLVTPSIHIYTHFRILNFQYNFFLFHYFLQQQLHPLELKTTSQLLYQLSCIASKLLNGRTI
jgi:hypothetical protein